MLQEAIRHQRGAGLYRLTAFLALGTSVLQSQQISPDPLRALKAGYVLNLCIRFSF